jgi:hypothetical protein
MKEKVAAYNRIYRQTHQDEILSYQKIYKQNHREQAINYQKIYRRTHPEKISAYQTNYRLVHPEIMAAIRMLSKYHLTRFEFDNILKSQSGLCAICNEKLTKPHIDHDHKTGKVRGLLCGNCNRAIGMLKDDYRLAINAANYLKQPEEDANNPGQFTKSIKRVVAVGRVAPGVDVMEVDPNFCHADIVTRIAEK